MLLLLRRCYSCFFWGRCDESRFLLDRRDESRLYVLLVWLLAAPVLLHAQNSEAIKEYNAGLQYYNSRNYEGALPFFESAVRKDASFIHAYRCLISCHEQLGNTDVAISYYQKVIALTPSDKALVYNLAMTYMDKKDYEKCKIYLQKAVEIDPTYTKAADKLQELEAYLASLNKPNTNAGGGQTQERIATAEDLAYNKALDEYKHERYENALNQLKKTENEATKANYFYLMALCYQQLGDTKNAMLEYEATLELDDQHFDANVNLGRLFYNQKNFSEAAALFETAYERRKNDLELTFWTGKAYYFDKSYAKAIPFLEKFMAANSTNGDAAFLLGDSYAKTNQQSKAAKYFDIAKQSGKNSDLVESLKTTAAQYNDEASKYAESGNYTKAIEVLEKAITEHSNSTALYYNLGLDYMHVGNVTKAAEQFKKTIEIDPSHAKALQALGIIAYDKQDFGLAAAYYQATVDAGKADDQVMYKLGSCYYKLGRLEQAADTYKKAIALNAQEKQYFFALGLTHLQLKENDKSIAAFQSALQLDPAFLDAQYHICVNYVETNRFQECIDEAAKIIAKDAKYAKAYLITAHSYKRIGNYNLSDKFYNKAVELDPSLRF